MKKISRKNFCKALLAVAGAAGLAACGGSSSSTAANSAAAPSAAGGEENITLSMSWWGGEARHEATIQALDAFHEKYPNVSVEYQYGAFGSWLEQLTVQIAGGAEPDVMQINWNWIYQFSPDGDGFTDLNEYSDIIDLTQYPQDLLDAMTVNGKLQGIPCASTGKCFYWNKTTFDKAGLDIPASFADMVNAGHVFQEKLGDDYYPIALTCYEQMMVMMYYLQQKYNKPWIADHKVNFTVDEVADGLDFCRMLEDNHVWPSQAKIAGDGATLMYQNQNWITGKYAGFYEWDSSLAVFRDALEEGQEAVVGPYPYDYGDVKTATVKISMAFAVKKNCAHPEEAARLIQFIQQDPVGVKILTTQRGIVVDAAAAKTLEEEGLLSGLTYEANKAAMENAGFGLDPYFEDATLKDATGLYFEIFEDLSYDNPDHKELAQRLIDGVNAVQEANL